MQNAVSTQSVASVQNNINNQNIANQNVANSIQSNVNNLQNTIRQQMNMLNTGAVQTQNFNPLV